jgi:hypothetical protein
MATTRRRARRDAHAARASGIPGTAEAVMFVTDGLVSKYGFEDGAQLARDGRVTALLDRLAIETGTPVDDQDLLVAVVRRFVVPRVRQRVTFAEVGTAHNPARAATVDGRPVRAGDMPRLTPPVVTVALADVAALARELAATAGPAS